MRTVKAAKLLILSAVGCGVAQAQTDTFWLATSGSGTPGIQNIDRSGITQRSIAGGGSGVAVDCRVNRLYVTGTFSPLISQYGLSSLAFIPPQLVQVPGDGFKIDTGFRLGPDPNGDDDRLLRTNYSHSFFQVVDLRHPNPLDEVAVTATVSTSVPGDSRGAATGITWATIGGQEAVYVALDSSGTIWKYDYASLSSPPTLFCDLSAHPDFQRSTPGAFIFGGLAYDGNTFWIGSGQRNALYGISASGQPTGVVITIASGAFAFGLEYSCLVPAPGTAALAVLAMSCVGRRRR